MAVFLPQGVNFKFGSILAETVITGIANAKDPVVTLASGNLAEGDAVIVYNDWARMRERAFFIGDSNNLTGADTASASDFPSAAGKGKILTVTEWTPLVQVTDISTSGGEQNFINYRFLENDYESQIPSTTSSISMTLTLAMDPGDLGQSKLDAFANSRKPTVLEVSKGSLFKILYAVYVGFQATPNMESNSIMTVTATFNALSRPTRYIQQAT